MVTMRDVTKRYKDFELRISLELKKGCITGLVGKNGAGKSSTFKAVLGLNRPDSGEIRVFGKSPGEFTQTDRQLIGASLAEAGFSMYLTVRDIVNILGRLYDNFQERWFLDKCREFELPLDKRLQTFSTGMKARLKVLAAVSHRAWLLVLDEPTAGLDVMARNELLDLLRGYMEEDEERSILISSHISSDLEGLCDDIYFIDRGKIILHENTYALQGSYGVLKVGEDVFRRLDKRYILRCKREPFGYLCLTGQKQFYADNYPEIVVEKGNIDDVMMLMIGGEKLCAD